MNTEIFYCVVGLFIGLLLVLFIEWYINRFAVQVGDDPNFNTKEDSMFDEIGDKKNV